MDQQPPVLAPEIELVRVTGIEILSPVDLAGGQTVAAFQQRRIPHADAIQPRLLYGCNAGGGIFDADAMLRRKPKMLHSVQIDIGGRLSVRDAAGVYMIIKMQPQLLHHIRRVKAGRGKRSGDMRLAQKGKRLRNAGKDVFGAKLGVQQLHIVAVFPVCKRLKRGLRHR